MHRKCLQCRSGFEPEHRGIFRCDQCKTTQRVEDDKHAQTYIGKVYADEPMADAQPAHPAGTVQQLS